jgi:hypothetical protein
VRLDSGTLKAEALAWLRYVKKMPVVVTEAGNWNADILGLSEKLVIEVEVKVSKADLRNEFKNKKAKHFLYNGGTGASYTGHKPNYFYIMVPEFLVEEAIKIVVEHSPNTGVLAFHPERNIWVGRRTDVARRASKLHDRPPAPGFVRTALLRASSELVGLWGWVVRMENEVLAHLTDSVDSVTNAGFRTEGALDTENVDVETAKAMRGEELQQTLEPEPPWETLTDDEKKKWIVWAEKLVEKKQCNLPHWKFL